METVDCELIRAGWLGQPVSALTALAFVAGGLAVVRRRRLRWVGIGMAAVGVGSFLFHGPAPPSAEWAHDVTLAWLLLVVGGLGRPWEAASRLPGLAALAVLFAVAPAVADPVAAVLAAVAVVSVLAADRSPATLGPLLLLGAVAVLGRLGSTAGPLCDPGSILQLHAVWHVGAAVAVTWWALGREMPSGRSRLAR